MGHFFCLEIHGTPYFGIALEKLDENMTHF